MRIQFQSHEAKASIAYLIFNNSRTKQTKATKKTIRRIRRAGRCHLYTFGRKSITWAFLFPTFTKFNTFENIVHLGLHLDPVGSLGVEDSWDNSEDTLHIV